MRRRAATFDGGRARGYRPRPVRSPAALAPILLVLLGGCARCAPSRARNDAGPPEAPLVPALLPLPGPWTFVRQRGELGLALPRGCRFRELTAQAQVPGTTRFVAEPRALGALVVADSADDPPRLTGVGALTLDPAGPSRDPLALPWSDPAALPRFAATGARWLASLDRPGAAGATRVAVWSSGTGGGAGELLGEGDGFEAADLACTAARCALLTSRLSRVAQPGATVWLGAPDVPASRWKPVELVPTAAESDARPLRLAAIDDARVSAALLERGEVVLFEAGDGGARETARLPAPHGALDAIALPRAAAMTLTSAIDDDGCARDGRPGVGFVRDGQPPVVFPAPAPPQRGVLRRLARGALAVWIAPLGCRVPRRVVYGVVLDGDGAPVGTPIPIGDAAAFAAAARSDDVDLYLQDATTVTWVRMACSAP
jgi:hypothetical protein